MNGGNDLYRATSGKAPPPKRQKRGIPKRHPLHAPGNPGNVRPTHQSQNRHATANMPQPKPAHRVPQNTA